MKKEEIRDFILKEKLIAIVRSKDENVVPRIIAGLVGGGVKVLEITSNTTGFERLIRESIKKYPDIIVGAGTVTNLELAKKAIEAGAQFLVSPNTQTDLVRIAHENQIPVVLGALTPTEVSAAVEADADIVKLFPAGNFGIDYLKAIMGPFDDVCFFAVGGIHPENITDWLEAGAVGVGVGSVLTKQAIASGLEELVASNASVLVKKIKEYARPEN